MLDRAPERLLMHTVETVAAADLLYVPKGGVDGKGIYYLATEIYPNRYNDTQRGEWQVKVFYADAPDGPFRAGRRQSGADRRARLPVSAHFDGTFYGYQSHLDHATEKWQMEVLSHAIAQVSRKRTREYWKCSEGEDLQ